MVRAASIVACGLVLALGTMARAQEGPLKVRSIDVDAQAGTAFTTVVVPVEPPVPVLAGAQAIFDALEFSRTFDGSGALGIRAVVTVKSGDDDLGYADLPDLQLPVTTPYAGVARRAVADITQSGTIDAIEITFRAEVLGGSPQSPTASVTGLEGEPGVTLYVAYCVHSGVKTPHDVARINPVRFNPTESGFTEWVDLNATGWPRARDGQIGLLLLDPLDGQFGPGGGSAFVQAEIEFNDGEMQLFDDIASPSASEPRALPTVPANFYGVDNAVTTDNASGVSGVRLRVGVEFQDAETLSLLSPPEYEMRVYRSEWGGCYADAIPDGLHIFDYLTFLNAFDAGDPYADCNSDGVLDLFDFLCYQNAFDRGCGGG